ncbi:MAG: hypothetical protein ACI8X5_000805 [Planctomycetota bacterium]|jgi:hypothetical protein
MNRLRGIDNLGKNIVVVVSLLAAGFFAAWLRFEPHLGSAGNYTDGIRLYDSLAGEPIRFAVWEEAQELPGELNSEEHEHAPALSADGRWIVFSTGERGLNAELWIAEMQAGIAGEPRPLYELNTTFDELAPAFGANTLYFASNRPGGPGGFDLWSASFFDGELGPASLIEGGVNTAKDEMDPAPLGGAEAFAFSSNRNSAQRKGNDLYIAQPSSDADYSVEPIEALNSHSDDREPAFTTDGNRIFFASDREGPRGSFDLYSSLYEHGQWMPPRAVHGLNSEWNERSPQPTSDGFGLLFERSRRAPNGDTIAANIFRARSLEVFQRPGPRVGWLDLLILIALLVLALLAALAKRWESIEVLYKCFLVSLIAHAALLWWFRDIHPESEIAALPQRGPTYQVSLASNPKAAARTSERGGTLQVQSDSSEREPAEPERLASTAARELQATQPTAKSLERRAAEPTSLPEASTTEVAQQAAPVVTTAQLKDSPRLSRQTVGQAPALVLNTPTSGAHGEHEPNELASLTRHHVLASQPSAVQAAGINLQPVERGEEELLPTRSTQNDRRPTQVGDRKSSLSESVDLRQPDDYEQKGLALEEFADPTGDALLASKLVHERSSHGAVVHEEMHQANALRVSRTDEAPASWTPATDLRAQVSDGQLLAREDRIHQPARSKLDSSTPLSDRNPESPPSFESQSPLKTSGNLTPQPSSSSLPERRREPNLAANAPGRRVRANQPSNSSTPAPDRTELKTDRRLVSDDDGVKVAARFEHTPYRTRFGPAKARALEEHGGSLMTEAAVAAGLDYLASIQDEVGFWGDARRRDKKYGSVFVGKTGLALLAFLGAGHTQESRSAHSPVVERALEFLLAIQRNDTGHFGRTSAYSHGIATYALAENYALTGDTRLKEPLERAVVQILRNQEQSNRDKRRFGGWSYYGSNSQHSDGWPRVSVSAWQVMALESSRLAGLAVPNRAFSEARDFLAAAMDGRRGSFRYSHDPNRLNGSYAILPGSTPAALFALSLLGEDLDSRRYAPAWDFLAERSPTDYRYTTDAEFVSQAQGNLYFWYYGSLASLRRGGKTWQKWNVRLKETLLDSQRSDGSWEPISIYARNYAADNRGDASYTTAMNVLSLEVYYRYFTPLLQANQAPARQTSGTSR